MGKRVHDHVERSPSRRLRGTSAEAVFFPGEVARLLGLDGIDYSQLRRLFMLARTLRGETPPPGSWSCFTLADLASAEVLVALAGGRERLALGRRLAFGNVEQACVALRQMGFEHPLLQVPLAREGRTILARVDAYVFEPASGQLTLEQTEEQVNLFLEQRIIKDRDVRAAIRAERRRLRPVRTRQLILNGETASLEGLDMSG
jgi:hypothetical protein